MKKYDISELEAELEGLSLLEKKSHLENVQNDIESEIEELVTAKDEVEDLLSDVENQINEAYKSEIQTALKGIPSDVCMLLPDNTLDIEGLKFGFYRFCEDDDTLHISISGRKHIVNTGDFNAEFKAFLQPILPDAKYKDMQISIRIDDKTDIKPLIKETAGKLINHYPKIAQMGKNKSSCRKKMGLCRAGTIGI